MHKSNGQYQVDKLYDITKQIGIWCQERNLWVFASYIASVENLHADSESRIISSETEWELPDEVFRVIENTRGFPSIDLFTYINNKCTTYVFLASGSVFNGSRCIYLEHFICFYAFLSFSLVLRTLRKIINDQAEGIVVVPYWPSQSWFPLFNQLLITSPLFSGPHFNLFSCPFRDNHPLAGTLILHQKIAWIL